MLPHSFHKFDNLANDYLYLKNYVDKNLNKIRIISSIEDVYNKYIYKEFDLCLAMRYHSIILSQVYGIPFI
jgi:polysaccharide pyruvyl transferase WcaK-like protein